MTTNSSASHHPTGHILVAEDHLPLWDTIRRVCWNEGWNFSFYASGEEALADFLHRGEQLDLAVVDIRLPGMSGLELLRQFKNADKTFPVVMMTAQSEATCVVECLKAGAYDYITKPFQNEDLVYRLRKTLKAQSQPRRVGLVKPDSELAALMGPSKDVVRLEELIGRVAPTDIAVLLEGESGSGKELLARRIHELSNRRDGPFVPVDCGAIPENLVESELFGFKKGSFTGAIFDKQGLFASAQGGTFFLDEIENLSPAHQCKLLRVLQDKRITPLGSTRPVPIDVRVISATNVSIQAAIEQKTFRLDLFHRLAEFPIIIPPIRQRAEDLLYLSRYFLKESCQELGKTIDDYSDQALEQILGYHWPGNVREIKSVIRRAVLLSEKRIEMLPIEDTSLELSAGVFTAPVGGGSTVIQARAFMSNHTIQQRHFPFRQVLKEVRHQVERGILSSLLGQLGGNKRQAAQILGLDYKTVHNKVKEYGIGTDCCEKNK